MENDTPDASETPEAAKPTKSDQVKTGVKKAAATAEKAGAAIEGAQNAFSAIKWVAISIVCLTILLLVWVGYKIFYKPVVAVSDAAGSVVEAVGDGAGAVKESASNMVNRLVITASDQRKLDRLAEAAFPVMNTMTDTKADGMRDRVFRRTNFGGSDNKICALSVNFGNGELPAFVGADNEAHATAKSLGSNDARLIRFVIMTEEDKIAFNTQWDEEAETWIMKWKKNTVKKEISDSVAEARIFDLLSAIPKQCKS